MSTGNIRILDLGRLKVRGWKHPFGLSTALALLLLLSGTAEAQPHSPVMHAYTAQLIRSEGFNPFKPMLADLLDWLPEAEITLEREADVLRIISEQELSSVELRAHLEPYGVQLGAFLRDGRTMDATVLEANGLPWLMDLDPGTELSPQEIAARKDAWVIAHPEEYERLLHAQDETHDRQ